MPCGLARTVLPSPRCDFAKNYRAPENLVDLCTGLRSPGLHPAQLEAFAPAMRRLATEGLGVSVRVLDVAPLSAARADATFDGLHYVREVPAAAVDAALGMLCEL